MKRIALCVGIDGYSNGIVPLSCAKNDAGRVYQQLLAEFDEVKYLHDFNASQNNIISETSAIAKRLEPGDIFLFYFSVKPMFSRFSLQICKIYIFVI